jgi:hypothetical protein
MTAMMTDLRAGPPAILLSVKLRCVQKLLRKVQPPTDIQGEIAFDMAKKEIAECLGILGAHEQAEMEAVRQAQAQQETKP